MRAVISLCVLPACNPYRTPRAAVIHPAADMFMSVHITLIMLQNDTIFAFDFLMTACNSGFQKLDSSLYDDGGIPRRRNSIFVTGYIRDDRQEKS